VYCVSGPKLDFGGPRLVLGRAAASCLSASGVPIGRSSTRVTDWVARALGASLVARALGASVAGFVYLSCAFYGIYSFVSFVH